MDSKGDRQQHNVDFVTQIRGQSPSLAGKKVAMCSRPTTFRIAPDRTISVSVVKEFPNVK
jgi:hypothetical protein